MSSCAGVLAGLCVRCRGSWVCRVFFLVTLGLGVSLGLGDLMERSNFCCSCASFLLDSILDVHVPFRCVVHPAVCSDRTQANPHLVGAVMKDGSFRFLPVTGVVFCSAILATTKISDNGDEDARPNNVNLFPSPELTKLDESTN